MDIVLEDITFTFPLSSYAGKDLILWGQPDWILRGDNARGALPAADRACLLSGPQQCIHWLDTPHHSAGQAAAAAEQPTQT